MTRTAKFRLMIALFVILLIFAIAPLLAPLPYWIQDRGALLQPPSPVPSAAGIRHWLGTDDFGRDTWSRLLYATSISTLLALAMSLPALGIALIAGMYSALAPRAASWLRLAGEVCRGLPWIFLLVAVRAALPLNSGLPSLSCALVVLFAAAAWPSAAWTFYGAARDLMQQDFMQASIALGAGPGHLLRRHLWPNLRGLAGTYLMLLFAAATLAEVSLALVGLGVPEPLPTWGNMLLPLRQLTVASTAWWLYAPLVVLVPGLVVLNLCAQSHRQISS